MNKDFTLEILVILDTLPSVAFYSSQGKYYISTCPWQFTEEILFKDRFKHVLVKTSHSREEAIKRFEDYTDREVLTDREAIRRAMGEYHQKIKDLHPRIATGKMLK